MRRWKQRCKRGPNTQEIAQIVRGPSGRASFTTQQGSLRLCNDCPELSVHNGSSTVRLAGAAVVVARNDFLELFAPA